MQLFEKNLSGVTYAVNSPNIKCFVKDGNLLECEIWVNQKFIPAKQICKHQNSVLLEYTSDMTDKVCYQEWVIYPSGGIARQLRFESKLPKYWSNRILGKKQNDPN